ncbi:MAG: DUF3742 family protein [Candidatus Accumulibacter sp.]|jgi:hypothetical protein|nr:DUF3742 family protein [Accumulibacter sp.]
MATQLAYRMGRNAGRAWRGLDRRAMNALAATGLPAGISKTLLWGIKLIVLGAALYVAFWLALVGFIIVVAIWGWWNAAPNWMQEEPEWRDGFEGFGLYNYDGVRIDYCNSDNYCCNDD